MGCRALLLKELSDTEAAPACRSEPEEPHHLPPPAEPGSLGEARLQWDTAHMLLPAHGLDCTGCDKQQPLLQSPQCPC